MSKQMTNKAVNWRRGTAMSEFVLALPLLLVVLALMLFMGHAMKRKQHVVAASRYAVWKAVETGVPSDTDINRDCLDGEASRVGVNGSRGPQAALDFWVNETYLRDAGSGTLADELLRDRWPQGRQAQLQADFPSSVPVHRSIRQDMSFQHGREGPEWIRHQASELPTLCDRYYSDLHAALGGITGPGAGLALRIQELYLVEW